MHQQICRLLLTAFCLAATQARALEPERQQAMSQACGLTAGRQQQYVTTQMQGEVPGDNAGLARYRELLRYSSPSARGAIRIARAAEPALVALDDRSFNDAVNLGIVLQSDPAIAAQATRQVALQKQAASQNEAQQLAALREAWTSLCLQQLKAATTLARTREQSLCNTFAVIGLMQRQRFAPTLKGKASPEQVEGMLRAEPDARSMIDDTVALAWVDDEMKFAAILRAATIAAEAPAKDVSGFRELAQQLAKDPLRLPYGNLCEAMASGSRPLPSSQPSGALTEVRARFEVIFRPNISDFYPPQAILDNQQGRISVRVCFNASGNVSESAVTQSSGSGILDDAAVKYAMLIRVRPALVNFVPQGDCVTQPVVFAR